MKLYIIEDDPMMADCLALSARSTIKEPVRIETFYDAVTAMNAVSQDLPDVILLDVMLSGPDGFTFLNEMLSYQDTARIPVILISSLDLSGRDLSHYGVVQILDKATMTPEDIASAIETARNSESPVVIKEAEVVEGATLPDSALADFNQKLKNE